MNNMRTFSILYKLIDIQLKCNRAFFRALTGISKLYMQYLEKLATLLISCFHFSWDDQTKTLTAEIS